MSPGLSDAMVLDRGVLVAYATAIHAPSSAHHLSLTPAPWPSSCPWGGALAFVDRRSACLGPAVGVHSTHRAIQPYLTMFSRYPSRATSEIMLQNALCHPH